MTVLTIIHTLLDCLSPARIKQLQGLFRWLHQRWQKEDGIYEILEYDTCLELKDAQGETAVFKKRQHVKFLHDYIDTFTDYAWGDGKIFAYYRCNPGQVVHRHNAGDRWNILIALDETKMKNDEETFNIRRVAKDGFTQKNESLQTEIRHPTRHLKITIIFPQERPCKSAFLEERSQNRKEALEAHYFSYLPDGRQILTWETIKIQKFEIYDIHWRW